MKTKIILILTFILAMTGQSVKAADQGQAEPVTITNEEFSVPGPNPRNHTQGVERPFTLTKKSEVFLTIASNKKKPSLNVYVLGADDYTKYENSGSLTNLNTVESLTKLDTLGFEASADLPAGKYVLIIHWGKSGFFSTAPAVGLRLMYKEEVIRRAQKPSITPTKTFWKRIF